MSHSPRRFTVRFWGVRGSVPAPGPETARYGGNTTCIEARCDDHVIVIDSGTGARRLGEELMREHPQGLRLDLLYSHLHLDHIQGLPFFAPLHAGSCRIDVHGGKPTEVTRAALGAQMAYPSFPVDLNEVASTLVFHYHPPGTTFWLGDVRVRTCALEHPGGAMALRLEYGGHVFVHASDVEHTGEAPDPELVELARDADVLSYDATWSSPEEHRRFHGWGHSTWQHGLEIARAAGAETFIAFHHAPQHGDEEMDAVAANMERAKPGSLVAYEGMTLELLAPDARHRAPGGSDEPARDDERQRSTRTARQGSPR